LPVGRHLTAELSRSAIVKEYFIRGSQGVCEGQIN
jgi:hypothetical protein